MGLYWKWHYTTLKGLPYVLRKQESNKQQPSWELIINRRKVLAFLFHSSWFSEITIIQTAWKYLIHEEPQYPNEVSRDNCPENLARGMSLTLGTTDCCIFRFMAFGASPYPYFTQNSRTVSWNKSVIEITL